MGLARRIVKSKRIVGVFDLFRSGNSHLRRECCPVCGESFLQSLRILLYDRRSKLHLLTVKISISAIKEQYGEKQKEKDFFPAGNFRDQQEKNKTHQCRSQRIKRPFDGFCLFSAFPQIFVKSAYSCFQFIYPGHTCTGTHIDAPCF